MQGQQLRQRNHGHFRSQTTHQKHFVSSFFLSARVRKEKPKTSVISQALFGVPLVLISFLKENMCCFSADDCLYLYYVCTDKVGEWPSNEEKCIDTYEDCVGSLKAPEQILGTVSEGTLDGGNSIRPTFPASIISTTTTTTKKPPTTTTAPPPTTTTLKKIETTTTKETTTTTESTTTGNSITHESWKD